MANYYASTRTNYFRVKDEEEFRKFMAHVSGTEDRVELWEEKDKNSNTVFGFGTLGGIAGVTDYHNDSDADSDDEDCEDDFDAFLDGLQTFVADDDAIIILESGHEKLRYELQVKHYMAVMNIDVAYIACLFSNSESDFVWRKIERDLDEEENNILLLQNFWNRYVLNRMEPPLTEKPDMVLAALSRYYGPADKNAPTVTVGAEFAPALEQLLAMKAQKKDLDAQSRKLDEQIKRTYAPIAELMGAACGAVCESNGIKYNISFAPQ